MDEDHLMRIDGDNALDLEIQGDKFDEFEGRVLPSDHKVVLDYRANTGYMFPAGNLKPMLGITIA